MKQLFTDEYREALSELNLLISTLEDDLKNKIPQSYKEFIVRNMKGNYIPQLDSSKSIYEQKFRRETYSLFAITYMKYLCDTTAEKDEIMQMIKKNK